MPDHPHNNAPEADGDEVVPGIDPDVPQTADPLPGSPA